MNPKLTISAACALCLALAGPAAAQAVDDGVMLAKQELVVGSIYSHDAWDEYWEGSLKRDNQNIGTLTTQTSLWFASYGVTERVTVMGAVPHVWTSASQGVLHSMQGFQDLSLTAKYRLFDKPSTRIGALRGIAVASGAIPITNYIPDFYPLSLGSASRRISGRFTLSAQPRERWSVSGSTAYTWRGDVSLDRPYYYTDDRFFLTNQVDLANVFDFIVSAAFADPVFPFGNPPYAARAYSYVAVAQYEALKAAWYYKFLYNRLGPARIDTRIQSLMPATGVPSYPSEDAVVSGVTAELLKLLFPTAVEQITLKAGEQRRAALVSGRASASAIAAGLALGQAVAAVFVARAGADGMRTAGGSPALIQGYASAAAARGEVPWQSRETPPRPPMLAAFRSVRAWMMTPDDIVRERPGPPPSTSSALMARELAEVKDALEGISREELAITYKWADGVSTPTPPGHWNYLAWPYVTQTRISEVRTARVLAFLNISTTPRW